MLSLTKHYLSVDIGAESGRLILGSLKDQKLDLKEIHRFSNGMVCLQGKYHWNIASLLSEIIKGIEICVRKEKIQPSSIGIDTWGVDYGLLTKDGTLLGLPFAYRDPRTQTAIEEFTSLIPREDIYRMTGTLFAPYNTLFQLYASQKYQPELINSASDLLFMPDLIAYLLTGEKRTEFSFATTSQLYNPITQSWEKKLLDQLGVSDKIMQSIVEPGSIIGMIDERICHQTGIKRIPVVAVATHDTNSAIAAIPSSNQRWAFISSGTWSLMGVEMSAPIINEMTYQMNFTNEGGVGHTFDVLKNHMGLWLLQQCRKCWNDSKYDYTTLVSLASQAEPFFSVIDIDHLSFLNPGHMPEAIDNYCRSTGQKVPVHPGQYARIILESIALKYKETAHQLNQLTGQPIEELFITGGGIHNQLLCQFTANSTGMVAKTALAEGSATGNILTQALGLGEFCSLAEIRQVVRSNCKISHFEPVDSSAWKEAYDRYQTIISQIQTQ